MQGEYNLFNPYVHLGQILAKAETKIRRGRGPARVAIHTGVSFRPPLRRRAALVATYAVVLQAMLAAFALPTAHAGGVAAFEICRSDRADGPAQPLPPNRARPRRGSPSLVRSILQATRHHGHRKSQ